MVFDTTYKNENFNDESAILVGKKFSLLERMKLKGIGSSRMIIKEISSKLNSGTLKYSETDYGNIEIRPKGVIIHYTRKLERFSWVVPYYQLVIYNTQFFSIHANGNYIQFLKNNNYIANKKFINKIVQLKNDSIHMEYYN